MDWIKIKTKHYLNTKFTLLEVGSLVMVQLLTAHLERVPTEEEIQKIIPEKTRNSIATKLQGQCTTLAEVLQKVCEDVATVLHNKRSATARKQKQRSYNKNDELSHVTPLQQIREDKNKIREDKTSISYTSFQESWNEQLSPKILTLSESRKQKIKARISKDKDFLQHFKICVEKIKVSNFLSGRKGDWQATFDWIIENDKNYIKVLEGNYEDKKNSKGERTLENARKYIESLDS